MKIYAEDTIPYTQEYYLQKNPISQRIIIWIISLLIISIIIFCSFAKFEEVIKVSGYIRPEENISTVTNAVTGRIKEISYKSGELIHKDDLLLKIDPTQFETEKKSLLYQINEESNKLEALYEIRKSINLNKNKINENYIEASLRFDSWKTNLQKLENIKNLNYEKYIQETKLPETMTTISRLHELESQYLISCNEYENFNISFQHDIESEIIAYETSKKINDEKLIQIDNSLKFTEVRAPINGIIQEIKVFNKGDWIQAGQQIINIIPNSKDSTKIELTVAARNAGKIEEGMKVKMRFPSLPYHEFGGAEGTIITIDPDNTKTQNGEAYFIIKTDIDKHYLSDKKGKEYPLKVGLQVDARIIVSKKTILNFVLEKMNLWY